MNMSNQLNRQLESMFQQQEKQCVQLASKYVEQTCKQAVDADFKQFETEFCKHELVRQYLSVLLFFANNNLISDAQERYLRFFQQIKSTQEELDRFKFWKLEKKVNELVDQADKELQQIISPMTQVYENGISKDYDQLAKVICTLQEKIDSAGSIILVKNTEKLKELNVLVK